MGKVGWASLNIMFKNCIRIFYVTEVLLNLNMGMENVHELLVYTVGNYWEVAGHQAINWK